MSFDTFKACVDKLPGNVAIHFSGMSEPWLNPECTRMLLYAHEKGFRICVFTTALGMTLNDIELIKGIPFDLFFLHLPNDKGSPGVNIDSDYLTVIKKLSESGIKNIRFRVFGKTHPLVTGVLKDGLVKEKSLEPRAGNLYSVPTLKGPIICKKGLNCNVLLPNGEVILCCEDYGIEHILGNLLHQDYASLSKGQEFAKVKEALDSNQSGILCRQCIFAAKRKRDVLKAALRRIHVIPH